MCLDVEVNPHKRTEGAAAADGDKYGDTSSLWAQENPANLTSFGKITKYISAPKNCIGGALANEGAEAPKPYLPLVEVRIISSAASGLLLAGTASKTLKDYVFSTASVKRSRRQANTAVR